MSADNLFKDYRWCGIVYRRLKGILVEGAVANDLMNEAMAKLLARVDPQASHHQFFILQMIQPHAVVVKLHIRPEALFKLTTTNNPTGSSFSHYHPTKEQEVIDAAKFERFRKLEWTLCGYKVPYEPVDSSDSEDNEGSASDTAERSPSPADGTGKGPNKRTAGEMEDG